MDVINKIRRFTVITLPITIFLFCLSSLTTNIYAKMVKIEGEASYTYGDNESLIEARQFCLNLAKRNAIESYCTFIKSESYAKNFQLEKDTINTIAGGYLKNVEVVEKKETGRNLFYKISGYVDDAEIEKLIKELVASQKSETILTESCPVINYEDANKYYGKCVTVEGRIVSTRNTGKVCYLNFNTNWRQYLTVVIFYSEFNKFHSFPERYYRNKMVRIEGYIERNEYNNRIKPQIILNNPNHIQIIE